MKVPIFAGLAATLLLCGCVQPISEGSVHHGRYAGIGIYSAGDLWSKIVASQPATAASARTTDDETIIVVVDSQTGEIRQCGNFSGVCVGMNPWTKALTQTQTAPVDLTVHAAPRPTEPVQEMSSPQSK